MAVGVLTVCVSEPVEAAKVASPLYVTVILLLPPTRLRLLLLVVSVACPLFKVTAVDPNPPTVVSWTMTLPVGVPVPLVGLTITVKVTGLPRKLGFCEDAIEAVVAVPLVTIWLKSTRSGHRVGGVGHLDGVGLHLNK